MYYVVISIYEITRSLSESGYSKKTLVTDRYHPFFELNIQVRPSSTMFFLHGDTYAKGHLSSQSHCSLSNMLSIYFVLQFVLYGEHK